MTAIRPNSFHFSQYLYQDGGSLLNDDNTEAVFNSDAGVAAVDIQKEILDDGSGKYWADADGDLTPAIKSGEVAMFQDGPYYMGLLKTGVPEQSGKWAVATAPFAKQPGSYLGGTGLGIPVQAEHKDAAWQLIQYLLRPENQIGVFTYAGAAPATTAALKSSELTKPDPYFGGEAPVQRLPRVDGDVATVPVRRRVGRHRRGDRRRDAEGLAGQGGRQAGARRRRHRNERPAQEVTGRDRAVVATTGRDRAMTATIARRFRGASAGYLLIAPAVVVTVVFLLIPMVVSGYWSLTQYNGIKPPVSSGSRITSTS